MKKILLASTVLVAASAAAHAEVSLSGDARMGITAGAGKDATFSSRARVKFTAAGETDGGLSYGASFRAADAAGAAAGTAGSVSVSGAFGSIAMGDNDSAANTVVGNVSGVGFTGLGDKNELGYLGAGKPNVLYTYTSGALTFAASVGQLGQTPTKTAKQDATAALPGYAAVDTNADAVSVGVKYSTDAYSVSLGYETADYDSVAGAPLSATDPDDIISVDQLTLGASATFSGATVKFVAADKSTAADVVYAVSVDYTVSGVGLTVFGTSSKSYGLGAAYDLGGGAKFVAGAVKSAGTKTALDAGLTFSF